MTHINLYLAGDSTMSNYGEEVAPRAGWGQVLEQVLESSAVRVYNEAASGRSSKSFIAEGWLEKIEVRIRKGDYLLVQFGHNDSKPDEERATDPYTTYQSYLKRYIEVARSKGAIPILITSIERRHFDESGVLKDTHGDYPKAMKQLAKQCDVALIDLQLRSRQLLEQLGPEQSKRLFLWLKPGEHANYPEGIQDNTHFSKDGAIQMAKLAVDEMIKLDLGIVTA